MEPLLFSRVLHYSVSELTHQLRSFLESEVGLQGIWVEGEVSNLARPNSGHLYFTLKDSEAQLKCVMWKAASRNLDFDIQTGMFLAAHGNISVYEAGGQYQLYTDLLQPLGEGTLFLEFELLKEKLSTEGLFDTTRKLSIPSRPGLIGVITSPTGAALRDILNTIRRRYPLASVILAPTPVQGIEAPTGIIKAIQKLNEYDKPDIIIIARGGGSIEDLWAFNNEKLVREIAQSKIPIITGIGHETDFTLADFAADLRAATPTAAAELATPVTLDNLVLSLDFMKHELHKKALNCITRKRDDLYGFSGKIRLVSPKRHLQGAFQQVDDVHQRIASMVTQSIRLNQARLGGFENHLRALDPMAIINRGYAIVTRKNDGLRVTDISTISTGYDILVRLMNGEFEARVTDVKERNGI